MILASVYLSFITFHLRTFFITFSTFMYSYLHLDMSIRHIFFLSFSCYKSPVGVIQFEIQLWFYLCIFWPLFQKSWPFPGALKIPYPYGRSNFQIHIFAILIADSDSSKKSINGNYSSFLKIWAGTQSKTPKTSKKRVSWTYPIFR